MLSYLCGWGNIVGSLLQTGGQLGDLSTVFSNNFYTQGKLTKFPTNFSRFLPGFFHRNNLVFQSVNYRFLPTFNSAYKNNNDLINF